MLSEILFDVGLLMCAITVIYGGIQGLFSLKESENRQHRIFAILFCITFLLILLAELLR